MEIAWVRLFPNEPPKIPFCSRFLLTLPLTKTNATAKQSPDVDIEEFHADFVATYQVIAQKLLQGLDDYPLLQGTARFKNPVSI